LRLPCHGTLDRIEVVAPWPFFFGRLLITPLLDLQRIAIRNTKTNLNAKGPYLVRQLSDCFAPAMSSNIITQTELDGST
jgi:hypothetical protein